MSRLPRITSKKAVNLWGLGFAVAGIAQAAAGQRFADNSRWGHSGWQREVAIWNFGTLTGLLALRQRPEDPDRALTIGFTTLSSLFALNHIRAAVSETGGSSQTHLEALAMNLVAIGVGVSALRQPPNRRTPAP